jgi:hypothetical protein
VAAEVRIDSRALADVLRGPQGPVARQIIETAERVRQGAKQRVGYDADPDRDPGVPHLRDTIVKRFVTDGNGFAVVVGSTAPHALLHHEGTRPHIIRPRRAQVLRFKPRGGTTFVFAREVHHPGTKPNHYLTDALAAERGRL